MASTDEIPEDAELWRRIYPDWIEPASRGGPSRPRSIAFIDNRSGELSVHVAALANRDQLIEAFPNFSIAAFAASLPRDLGYVIEPRPTQDDPSHAVIVPKMTRKHAKVVANACTWVVQP